MLSGNLGADDERVLVGLDAPDDAAVFAWSDDSAVVSTLDFFTPIVDDPYVFGAIAAANALSDMYAMGGEPLFALNIVGFPKDELGLDVLVEILRGGSEKAAEAGVPVIGGHSIDDREPKYGMVVVGRAAPDRIYRKSGGRAGDRLVLGKPLGTGIISTGIKRGEAAAEIIEAAVASMLRLNREAGAALLNFDIGAVTDVTGFGLVGHLSELARLSGLAAVVRRDAVPLLPGVRALAESGNVPGGTRRNLEHVDPTTTWGASITELDKLLLCDAQTSGGLLVSVAAEESDALARELGLRGYQAGVIGDLVAGDAGRVEVI